MYQRMTRARGTCVSIPHAPGTPHLGHGQASGSSPSSNMQGSMVKLRCIRVLRPKCCASSGELGSSVNEGSFLSLSLLFCFTKMPPTWIPKHFRHPTWKHWWMKNNHKSCVSVNSIRQLCGYRVLILKHMPGKETVLQGLLHTVTRY